MITFIPGRKCGPACCWAPTYLNFDELDSYVEKADTVIVQQAI